MLWQPLADNYDLAAFAISVISIGSVEMTKNGKKAPSLLRKSRQAWPYPIADQFGANVFFRRFN